MQADRYENEGTEIIFYHGSNRVDAAFPVPLNYLTSSIDAAMRYGKYLHKAYLHLQNPLILSGSPGTTDYYLFIDVTENKMQEYKDFGYDSVVYFGKLEDSDPEDMISAVIFEEQQLEKIMEDGGLLAYKDLPQQAKKDVDVWAEVNANEYFFNNEISLEELRWSLQHVPMSEALIYIDEDTQRDDDFIDASDDLSKEIDRDGLLNPPIQTPTGFEGCHRTMGMHLLGKKEIPVYKLVLPEEELKQGGTLKPSYEKIIRTPEFKAWFGDWEHAYKTAGLDFTHPAWKNVSKVVDRQGKPLVVYHGSRNWDIGQRFNVFRVKTNGDTYNGAYFTDNRQVAVDYSNADRLSADANFKSQIPGNKFYECFLNIRKLYNYDAKNDAYEFVTDDLNEFVSEIKRKPIANRGVIIENIKDSPSGWSEEYPLSNIYVVFNPTQIKLADGTNTTFDGSNPDIRFNKGGSTALLAPNGKPSNLTAQQYSLVRTPEFKAWFGDWEHSPATASKVVDENGEPLVVYHGTNAVFNQFDKAKIGKNYNVSKRTGFHFAKRRNSAENFAKLHSLNSTANVIAAFIQIKNPILRNTDSEAGINPIYYVDLHAINLTTDAQHNNNDGIIVKGTRNDDALIVFEPTQIKLADGTNSTFDGSNPDIRFNKGGSTALLAPNGKPSNLTAQQYSLVRTPEFKAWFGDWEHSPETASKVVDENGEPRIMYHGTPFKFTEFTTGKIDSNWRYLNMFFATPNKQDAEMFGKMLNDTDNEININVLPIFINAKKIFDIESNEKEFETLKKFFHFYGDGKEIISNSWAYIEKKEFVEKILLKKGYDSAYITEFFSAKNIKSIGVFSSSQIKLADGTNSTFDGSNPDIRFEKGGNISDKKLQEEYGDLYWKIQWGKGDEKDKQRFAFLDAEMDRISNQARVEMEQEKSEQSVADELIEKGEISKVTPKQFLNYHRTGYLDADTYKKHRQEEYWEADDASEYHQKSRFPILVAEKILGGKKIEFRKEDRELSYAKVIDGQVQYGPDSRALSLTRDEIIEQGLPLTETDIHAFHGEKEVGHAADSFGATEVFVRPSYQKLGIGTELIDLFHSQFSYPRKVGQMTQEGANLVKAWHRKLTGKLEKGGEIRSIPEWIKVPKGMTGTSKDIADNVVEIQFNSEVTNAVIEELKKINPLSWILYWPENLDKNVIWVKDTPAGVHYPQVPTTVYHVSSRNDLDKVGISPASQTESPLGYYDLSFFYLTIDDAENGSIPYIEGENFLYEIKTSSAKKWFWGPNEQLDGEENIATNEFIGPESIKKISIYKSGGNLASSISFEQIMLLPDIESRRSALTKYILEHPAVKIIVAFSGGKDSIAMVLHLLELGVPKSQIELWHHDVDGHAEELFDWKVTPEYCQAFANAMGITLLFSYREGGIVKRLLRNNEPRGNVFYQTPDFQWHTIESNQDALNTGGRWPSVSANLQSRWCSSEVKIDVASTILANDPRLSGTAENPVEIVFCTGERHSESPKRSTYEEMQVYKKGSFTVKRKTIAWRLIIEKSEEDVWASMKKWNIQPHPCYYLNWNRCSCQICIFNEEDYWATVLQITPQKVERVRQLEKQTATFVVNQGKEHTLYNKMDIYQKCDSGTPVIDVADPETQFWIKQATEKFTLPIFVEGEWILPLGAFKKENCGAS